MSNLFSIVIPVYNSSRSLIVLADKIDELFSNTPGQDYEIIFIDDGSANPNTWRILTKLATADSRITALRLMRNFGQQAATLCGLREARGDLIITMDDDLQHDPAEITKLLAESSHDIVIAQFTDRKHSFFKRVSSDLKGWFDYLILGKPRDLKLSSFRVLNRDVVNGMLTMESPYPFIPALMFHVTRDIVGVQVKHDQRSDGTSGYSFWKLIRLFSNLLINNSSLLLRFIGIMGWTCALFSLALIIYFICKKIFFGILVPGWTSVIVLILFFGGATLFSIGIIGEYLIRIIRSVEKKSSYVIRDKIHGEKSVND